MSFRVEHRMGVPAPASVIWEVLSDLPGWSAWNPIYPKIEGQLRIGAKLEVHEAFEGAPSKVITPTVVDWVPDAQILWTVSEAGGMIRRIRYIEIDTFEESASGSNRWRLRKGFEAFNTALAEQVARRLAHRGADGGR